MLEKVWTKLMLDHIFLKNMDFSASYVFTLAYKASILKIIDRRDKI